MGEIEPSLWISLGALRLNPALSDGMKHAPEFDPASLLPGTQVRALGRDPRRTGLIRVRRGYWMEATLWAALPPGQRHAALVKATALAATMGPTVFTHAAAAAIWGMPRIERWPSRVDVLDHRGADHHGSGDVLRWHRITTDDVVERAGLHATSAARTVIDLAAQESLATGLASADYTLGTGLCNRDDLLAALDELPRGARGRRRAGVVVRVADGLSGSPGESLSRAQMFTLGLPRPTLQRSYADSAGFIGIVDFDWDGTVGEFDGRVKYGVDSRSASAASDILWAEKLREDRLRRVTRGFARWTYADALDARRLAARLAPLGIRPVGQEAWLEAS